MTLDEFKEKIKIGGRVRILTGGTEKAPRLAYYQGGHWGHFLVPGSHGKVLSIDVDGSSDAVEGIPSVEVRGEEDTIDGGPLVQTLAWFEIEPV